LLRVLFLADTHLGFDDPLQTRVERRRRGPDFYDNFRLALQPARNGEVDVVIHGGDIFFRSKVRPDVVQKTLGIIAEVTDRGVPFVLVPGNHERSATPLPLLWDIEGLFVFRKPDTFIIEAKGERLALAGFPCERNGIRQAFPRLLAETGWDRQQADIRLLCMHQTVEGATVGPEGYTFRGGDDIIPGRMIPGGFAAVLSGHIHRAQALRHDVQGNPLAAPVIYPGSTERTAFAEKDETKGYVLLDLMGAAGDRGRMVGKRFIALPTRPMVDLTLSLKGLDRMQLDDLMDRTFANLNPDCILRLTIDRWPAGDEKGLLSVDRLRKRAPQMNFELRWRTIDS
jgi:DNA repair exonuclease SbcCD nuclease subunit